MECPICEIAKELHDSKMCVPCENKKLKKCVEFYANYNYLCSKPPFYDLFNFCDKNNDYENRYGVQVAGKRARQLLKDLKK